MYMKSQAAAQHVCRPCLCSELLSLRTAVQRYFIWEQGQDGWTCWPWALISVFDPHRGCSVSPSEVTSHVMVDSWDPTPPHVIQQGEQVPWQQAITCAALAQPLLSLYQMRKYEWRTGDVMDVTVMTNKRYCVFNVSSLTCACISLCRPPGEGLSWSFAKVFQDKKWQLLHSKDNRP